MEAATLNGLGLAPKVQLGQHEFTIYPQRHAYLTNRLGRAISGLQDTSQLDTSSMEGSIAMLGDRAYDFLAVFIPNFMPEWEFRGFPTREAMEAGDYNEEYDNSPSFPEIVNAFQVCLAVNRLDLLKHLGKVVNMDLVKAYANKAMLDFFEGQQPSSSDTSASTSTSSGA